MKNEDKETERYESFKNYATNNITSINKLIEIATEAGLDISLIKVHETTNSVAWHNVFVAAKQHNKLNKLYSLLMRYHHWVVNHILVPSYLDRVYGAMDRVKR